MQWPRPSSAERRLYFQDAECAMAVHVLQDGCLQDRWYTAWQVTLDLEGKHEFSIVVILDEAHMLQILLHSLGQLAEVVSAIKEQLVASLQGNVAQLASELVPLPSNAHNGCLKLCSEVRISAKQRRQ
jgi:hypothetical protein